MRASSRFSFPSGRILENSIIKEDISTNPGVISLEVINVMVYLKSKNISTDFTILPQILNIDPIMGDFRTCVKLSNPTIITAAKRSGMKVYEYLSTIYNLGYVKESGYRDMCKRMYGGVTEVVVPGIGRIDVLTADRVIEVKNINLWKSGLGQVLCYTLFYPNHQATLALTPCKTCYKIEEIERICNLFNVDVIWL